MKSNGLQKSLSVVFFISFQSRWLYKQKKLRRETVMNSMLKEKGCIDTMAVKKNSLFVLFKLAPSDASAILRMIKSHVNMQ